MSPAQDEGLVISGFLFEAGVTDPLRPILPVVLNTLGFVLPTQKNIAAGLCTHLRAEVDRNIAGFNYRSGAIHVRLNFDLSNKGGVEARFNGNVVKLRYQHLYLCNIIEEEDLD